jgi:hypothetical protein
MDGISQSKNFKPYNNFRISYSTVDFEQNSSFYLALRSWITPVVYQENYYHLLTKLKDSIRKEVHDNLDRSLFYHNFIIDFDVTYDSIVYKRNSFLRLEITFFPKSFNHFRDPHIETFFHTIGKTLVDKINTNPNFEFCQFKR